MNPDARFLEQQIYSILLQGKFLEAEEIFNLNKHLLTSKQKSLIQSFSLFWRGRLESHKSTTLDKMLIYMIVESSILRSVLILITKFVGIFITSLKFGQSLDQNVFDKIIPKMVHNRYGNIEKLAVQSFLLHYLDIKVDPLWKGFIEGCLGYSLCCHGQFKSGLKKFENSLQTLSYAHEEANAIEITNFLAFGIYMEFMAGFVFQLENAGHKDKARIFRDKFYKIRQRHAVYWAEIYLRAMDITSAIEMLDENLLQENASRIQEMLGEHFSEKFGLRIAAARAYLATIHGDFVRAKREIFNAEYYYQTNKVDIELFRYHQLRSHCALAEKDVFLAKFHAERSLGFISLLPGARLQKIEAELTFCEVLLHFQIWTPSNPSDAIAFVRKMIKKAKSQIKGSDLIDATIDVLNKSIRYLEHQFDRDLDHALRDRLLKVSRRKLRLYDSLVFNHLGKENCLATLENHDILKEKNLISLLNIAAEKRILGPDHEEAICAIFRADGCKRTNFTEIDRQSNENFTYYRSGENKFNLTIFAQNGKSICFYLFAPRVDLKFDRAANEYLQLLCTIIRECEAHSEILANNTNAAIAKTTQMLAHDVRKPFSMLKTGLNLLQASSSDPNKFKSNLSFLVSEVDRATRSVDGMLTDVMEIGSTSIELIQEPTSPEALIESTLGEVFRVYPKSKIAIAYDFKHSAMVHVHLKKVSRVFSNVVGNAVQAMSYSGGMWFKTKMNGDFVEFCIGNAGSVIPPESLAKLFQAFFTSGKKGGTGLGLAIAQKVVHAHGGKIWCESSKTPEHPDGKVEFFFTLPVAKEAELLTTANLPKHSDEITQMIAMMGQASASKSDSEFNRSESLLHQDVVQRATALSRHLGVLIVDDESIYRSALASWIQESPELVQLCNIHHASGSTEAFDTLTRESIDLIITDIDMGPRSLCGFDLVTQLRNTHNFKGLIFVHSNRIVPEDHRRAGDLGANGFLPKPMAKGQLFKLLLQTIQGVCPLADTITSTSATVSTLPIATNPKEVAGEEKSPYNLIAIIDDEDIFRDQWPAFLKGFDTACYATAEEFVKDWDQVSGRLIAVLTDKYLGAGIDGLKLGTMLRQKAPDLAIILSTSDMSVKDTSNIFDLIVDKDAFEEAPKITQYLQSKAKDENLSALMRKTIRAFDSNVRDLDQTDDASSIIDSHILSWQFVLKDLDQPTKAKLKESMTKTEADKLKHDIKGSISRLKILLRNLDLGELDRGGTISSLKSRVTDMVNL